MHNNRDMFYSDYQAGAYMNPTPGAMGPGYGNMATGYNAMGPGYATMNQGFGVGSGGPFMNQGMVAPNAAPLTTPLAMNNNANYYDSNYLENRMLKIERQVKRLESRVTRLENLSGNSLTDDISSTTDMYMI